MSNIIHNLAVQNRTALYDCAPQSGAICGRRRRRGDRERALQGSSARHRPVHREAHTLVQVRQRTESTDGYIANAHHPLLAISAAFSRLPYWVQAICPRVFYVTEKSWNYYPYTMTGKGRPFLRLLPYGARRLINLPSCCKSTCRLQLSWYVVSICLPSSISVWRDIASSYRHTSSEFRPMSLISPTVNCTGSHRLIDCAATTFGVCKPPTNVDTHTADLT